MSLPIPTTNGQVIEYAAAPSAKHRPRIYYVNGIQNDGRDHAETAHTLSSLTEHVVHGVYNATAGKGAGIILDLLQCSADWIDIFLSKLAEIGNKTVSEAIDSAIYFLGRKSGRSLGAPFSVAEEIRRRISPAHRLALIDRCLRTYNRATASLFRQLSTHSGQRQIIVAHSQGNLIAADALWSMVFAFGETSLASMQVYSLASPSPAWPLGIRFRRKVYGHTNDLVTLFDPHNWTPVSRHFAGGKYGRTAGDWRQHGTNPLPGLDGHKVERNIALNFAETIRRDLGLPRLAAAK